MACPPHVARRSPVHIQYLLALEGDGNADKHRHGAQTRRVTKGNPLTMILYGIGVFSIKMIFHHNTQDVEINRQWGNIQVWFADNSEISYTFSHIKV